MDKLWPEVIIMPKDPGKLAAERPVGNEAVLDVNGGVSSSVSQKAGKAGPPKVGEDAWLPS